MNRRSKNRKAFRVPWYDRTGRAYRLWETAGTVGNFPVEWYKKNSVSMVRSAGGNGQVQVSWYHYKITFGIRRVDGGGYDLFPFPDAFFAE